MEDIRPDAVKIGMINDVEIVEAIASCLRTYRPPFRCVRSGHGID